MRLLKKYRFQIGTKIPYPEWTEIVQSFLAEHGLSYHRFLYYFKDIIPYQETHESKLPRSGCARILKDLPSLGQIHYHNRRSHGRSDFLMLTNIDQPNAVRAEDILPLMKKIHRTYGFTESDLFYIDMDFWGKTIPFDRDYSVTERMCRADNIPFDPKLYVEYQPCGSGIRLHRDACSNHCLELTIDLLHNGKVLDPTPYFESLQKLLPRIKVETSLQIFLTNAEQERIAQIDREAMPVLEQCRAFFAQHFQFNATQNTSPSNYSIAKPLKKLAKQYGYAYHLVWNGVYALEKRTMHGAVLYLEVDSGPSHYDLGFELTFQGVGFKHTLGIGNMLPANQQEVNALLTNVLSVIDEFETTLLPSLDMLYPETPGWFIPSD